ncbi:MAG: DNA repair protein RecO [Alicyclobacillus sp.]|nr:DNA repair protein RecO [Alicyclobacillus sp.]
MVFNTEAIVIRSIAYGETHAIVTLLTPEGTVAAMARGGKKPQSRLAAGVQLCSQGVYTLYQRTGMANIQQVEVHHARRMLREQLELAAYAAYFCELVQTVAEERPHGSEAVYRLFMGALDRLLAAPDLATVIARIWEAKIARMLGVAPDWQRCMKCSRELMEHAWYLPEFGGLVCTDCRERMLASGQIRPHNSLSVGPKVPRLLAIMSDVPWAKIGRIALSLQTQQTIGAVLREQLLTYGGLSLRTRNVLDSLEIL